jgi:diguanylate cyclase (GGDEF)-like protein/PAS domain S-box-containing protein
MKPEMPHNETDRVAWLRECRILDTEPETEYDDITRLAAQICGVPIAAITLIDEERQWFKSVVGIDIRSAPREASFCAHAILESNVLIVEDAALDERFAHNPFVVNDPHIRFYAGAPLVSSEGLALGALCVVDRAPRQMTEEQKAILKVLAGQVAGRMELQRRIALQASAEENFASLFEHAPVGIFQTTPKGQYLRVNPALARIYGYDSPEQMIGELVDISGQLYVEDGRRSEFQELMAMNGSIAAFESEVRRRDGSVIWISEIARLVRNAHGQVSYYEGFVRDITDRIAAGRQRESELMEAQMRVDRDSLTDLWNHRAFHNRVDERLAGAERDGGRQAIVMLDVDNFKFFNDLYGHVMGDEVLRMVAGRLEALCGPFDILARFGGDEFAILMGDLELETRDDLEGKLTVGLGGITFRSVEHGAEVPITISVGAAISPVDGQGRLALLRAVDERLRWAKTGGRVERSADPMMAYRLHAVDGFSMLDALVTAVDNKDRYTRCHSEDVMNHCLAIASRLGLSKADQHDLAVAAMLHDVGKIGVPDAILRKPGKLTDSEYAAIKLHPTMGAAIVSTVPGLEATLDAVRHHHENYDGTGYPFGLKGSDIPLIARIMAVADAYSAMTMDRPYREGMGRRRALSILADGAGKHWDVACVAAFLEAEGGLVVEPQFPLRAA